MKDGLSQDAVQTAVMAPQLRQGLRFLAMSLPDLRSELVSEMASNPVIEDVEQTLEQTVLSQKEAEFAAAEPASDYPEDDNAVDAARLAGMNRPDDYAIGGRYDGRCVPDADAIERRQRLFDSVVGEETLTAHLLAQLDASDVPEADRALAELLIGDLDEDGRFAGDVAEVASVTGADESRVLDVLRRIRAFDPPGCGARTLGECLEAQLDSVGDAALRARVRALLGRLDDVARGRVADAEALKALRSLDPRPGRAYGSGRRMAEFVNPEVSAVRGPGGSWIARVDARSLPEIRISARYLSMLSDPQTPDETRAYIRERIAAAKAVVAAVAKRRETVERIAQEIVDRQPGFFEHGLGGLRPMTMQEVADAVGVHGTTVSRTVNGKYMATPKGVVELRRFFVGGVVTDSGESVSRDGVVARLQTLVAAEDAAHPLSDAALAERLHSEGFPVARRTVAKYRVAAGIPSTSERRNRGGKAK